MTPDIKIGHYSIKFRCSYWKINCVCCVTPAAVSLIHTHIWWLAESAIGICEWLPEVERNAGRSDCRHRRSPGFRCMLSLLITYSPQATRHLRRSFRKWTPMKCDAVTEFQFAMSLTSAVRAHINFRWLWRFVILYVLSCLSQSARSQTELFPPPMYWKHTSMFDDCHCRECFYPRPDKREAHWIASKVNSRFN